VNDSFVFGRKILQSFVSCSGFVPIGRQFRVTDLCCLMYMYVELRRNEITHQTKHEASIIIIILSHFGRGGPLWSQTSVLAVFPMISSLVVCMMLSIVLCITVGTW
jgi:hypothetical protein